MISSKQIMVNLTISDANDRHKHVKCQSAREGQRGRELRSKPVPGPKLAGSEGALLKKTQYMRLPAQVLMHSKDTVPVKLENRRVAKEMNCSTLSGYALEHFRSSSI